VILGKKNFEIVPFLELIKGDFKDKDPVDYIEMILKGGGRIPTAEECDKGEFEMANPELANLFDKIATLDPEENISIKTL
jgi:hypothetical protein